jgi:SNF2 family DNA or RNA helicase
MIHISHQTQSIAVPFDAQLGSLFPHGLRLEYEGEQLIVVPHGIEETRMLRNLGHELPSPIEEHYDFPSIDGKRPFAKQVLTAVLMVMNRQAFVLNSMGTGKTKSCIWAYHFLRKIGKAKRMLVVCPLSTVRFTWEREIFNTIPGLEVRSLLGTKARRLKLLAEKADIYLINHDGVGVIFNELRLRSDINVVCFDEAAAYRNARATRSKIARELAITRAYVWGMTGSPTPTAPTDAFGLARLITPETAPKSFTHFRQETMLQVDNFIWKPKRGAAEIVAGVLQPSVRYTLDEIVELPPVIEREIIIEMGPRQAQTYKMLKDHASVLLKEGTITAVNGGVLYSKLLQTSIGWVYGDDGNTYELDNHNRINALLDIIESADSKVIVFSPFISAMDGIAKELAKARIDFATISGDTPHAKRGEVFQAFQFTDKIKVLNAHPECMSHGLNLTAADTVIWFGPTTKLETFEQANARIRRIGQTKKQQIIKLVASQAERSAYARLAQRQDLQTNVLGLIAELTGNESGNGKAL